MKQYSHLRWSNYDQTLNLSDIIWSTHFCSILFTHYASVLELDFEFVVLNASSKSSIPCFFNPSLKTCSNYTWSSLNLRFSCSWPMPGKSHNLNSSWRPQWTYVDFECYYIITQTSDINFKRHFMIHSVKLSRAVKVQHSLKSSPLPTSNRKRDWWDVHIGWSPDEARGWSGR